MPNPLKGETPLKLGAGEFVLVLDHEALIEAESLYGKPLAMLMADATLGFAGACRALLYGALRAHHPQVTAREASTLFLENSDAVSAALAEAAEAAFPKSAEGKQDPHPPMRAPAGKRSGASGAKSSSIRKPSSGRRRAATS
jgi:hypothetical protein